MSAHGATNGSAETGIEEYDAIIVGAGFGAFTTLQRFRRLGLKVKVWEKGSASGGIW